MTEHGDGFWHVTAFSSKAPGMLPVFFIRSSICPQTVRNILDTVRTRLVGWSVPQDGVGLAEIVLAETLNNIVEHAYRGKQGANVALRIRLRADRLQIRIVDRGAPMPGGRPPAGSMPSVDGDIGALPEGGFGWPLIHMLTGDVRYIRKSNGNVIDLDLPLIRPPASQ